MTDAAGVFSWHGNDEAREQREQERAARGAEVLQAQIKEDAMRQLLAREEYSK
ncbi:hypothetical protein F5887DRAFT_1071383 [Amanita rubescens]|nr:hypothetical protein F5887DRAFT_1071383 [Amanita rubescens]